MNKFIKYILLSIALILIGYNSLYIKKLSDVNKSMNSNFDATAFAKKIWTDKLPSRLDSAIDINNLKQRIETNPTEAFNQYTNALDIGNNRYALVKGEGIVDAVNEDDVAFTVKAKRPFNAILATEFVYGNTLRDAAGLFNLKDFPNTTDLNNLSKELNNIVRNEVVPSFKSKLKRGVHIEFIGAIELNKEHIHFDGLEIIPIKVKIIP